MEYDSSNNKIGGFVLPLDCNSLPDKTSFYATSFADIENMFLNSKKASSAYIYMVQLMSVTVPPFFLALIGTDNCLDAKPVLQQWNYIVRECNNRGIQVISFSADRDSRLLTSMRLSAKLDNYSPSQYKNCPLINDDMFAQYPPLELPSS